MDFKNPIKKRLVQKIKLNYVLLKINFKRLKYVFQFMKIKQKYLMNNIRINLYNLIRVVKVSKLNVNHLAFNAIILDVAVRPVKLVTGKLTMYVSQFEETKQQQKVKNVMMGIQILKTDVINVLQIALSHVHFVYMVIVQDAKIIIFILKINVMKYKKKLL
ncbi:unnamed protein product [Paramecium pentaurelia]|uniref:Transmembrane protein n=1 Tax=Paramecium pentaurelia TaxID=43138 RepID=A0A8S1S8V3_9CILI|nr:unnamed protein product [Paramecium pentaurelia]